MERNAGMSFEMISSSALGSNDLHLYQNMDADDSVKSLNYSLSEQLDLEVQKLEEMVKCLESLERDLQPSEQLRQTTSETCQTNGALNNQNVYVNVDIDEMERPQRSGIPIPRRSSRGATGISPTSSEMKSPPPLARKPKVERHEAGLVKLSYRDEGKMAERPEENYNLGNKETVQLQNSDVDDTKSYTESVSVSSTANMFGGQAVIRRIPTPNSRSRQESNQPKVPSIKNIGNEQNNIEHDDDDVLDQPLKSLSEINGISDLESYDNIDNNEIPSYEQFLDEAIENTDKTVADFKAGKIPMDIEPTKIEHEYATMDYTILGTISSIKDDGANKGDNSKEEMSFVFGRPKLPIVSDSSLKRCLSPPYDSKVTFSQSAPSKRVASGLRSRPLPPLPPGARERSKLREITNHVGIMCEGCNNCLLELKRQSLRLMYPGGETRAVPIESIDNFEDRLQVSENGYRFNSGGQCEVCDTHVNQLKREAISMVQSIQKAQSDQSSTTATNLPKLIGSIINLPATSRKVSTPNGPHIRYRSSKSSAGNYLSKSAPIGIQAQAYLEQNVRSRPTQKRFPQMLVRPGHQDKQMFGKGVEMYQQNGSEGMGQFGRQPHYPISGSQFINTPYMQQQPIAMQAFHPQQQQIQHQHQLLHQQQQLPQFYQQQQFQQQQAFQPQHQQQQQHHAFQQQQIQQQIHQQQQQQQIYQHHYSPQHQQHYPAHHQHMLHHSNSAPGSPIRIQSPPPRMSRITSPPPSSPSLSRLSSLSPPPSASPAANFFARAAQKLSKKKKRHHPPEPEPPPFPTKFSETLRLIPPPCPPCLLRNFGLGHAPGVGKVKVMLRIISGGSHGDQSSSFLHIDTRNKQVTVYDPAGSGYATSVAHRKAAMAPKMFAFDGVFTPDHAMTEVCAGSLTEIIQGVVAGADGCIFTYGYSKTGKTSTMVGSDHSSQTVGIIPCAIAWLFKVINEQKDQTGARFSVRVSAVEVSGKQETLRDLLAEVAQGTETGVGTAPGVYLREDPISGTQLENQSELRAPTAEQAAYYLDAALHARSQSDDESRSSHLLFTLHVYQYRIEKENKAGLPGVAGGRSRLHLIDLGSASKSKDPNNVALSLSALGNVIMALVNGQRHVPHRNSKIAQLMRDSLGNVTCRTCMIAHVSQSVPHYNESLQVIQLAARIQRMRRRKIRGQFSGTSSDDSSTDGSSIRSRPLRGFRMGTLHETSSLSDPDYTSSSEQSCDTVIYTGRNGQSLSDRELTDHEGPPRSVPRTNPRLPRRASGSRSSGDEGSNSDSGRSLYKSRETLFRSPGHLASPVRDVTVATGSRHGTPVRSLSRGSTPVRDPNNESSPLRATSPPPVAFNLPRKGNSRTKTLPSKQESCYASVNIVDKMSRSTGKTKRSNSLENKEGEQWIDGPGAAIYPEKKKAAEQWIDGPPSFVVKPEPKKADTKMSSEEMWVDGPPEMLVENQMDENQNRTPKLVMPATSSKKAHVRSLSSSPKHQSPMNSPATLHRGDRQGTKQTLQMKEIKERPESSISVESTNSNVAQQGDSRPNSMVTMNGEADEVMKIVTQDGRVKPFVRDWVEKHGLGDSEKDVGLIMDCEDQVIGTLESASGTYRRPKPHDSRTKNLIPASSTPKQSPKNSPSAQRKVRSTTPKLVKSQLPAQGSTTKRVTDWLKSVEKNQPEETIYMEGIVGKQVVKTNTLKTEPDQEFELLASHINKSTDISSCSSMYPDTSLNDSRTQECTDIDNSGKTDNSVTDCNIADMSFDSSVETSNSAQNRDSIYELQMDEQLENALIGSSQKCDTDMQDDETFSNASCAKNSDIDMSEAFVETMEMDGNMKKSETLQSIKTLVGEAEASSQENSDNIDKMCNDEFSYQLDFDPTVRLLSRKPDGASNPNLICETFTEKTNIAALREEFLITNALSSQSEDISIRSLTKSGRSGEGDGQTEDKYNWEKSDTLSPLKTSLPSKVCSKCGYSQQNSKPISKMCKDCQKMVALSIKNSHSSLTRRDKDKTKHVLYSSSSSSGSPSSSATVKSSKSKSQSPSHSRLPIFSKNLQVSSKDSKLSRKKEKENKKVSSRTIRNNDSDSGNDSVIVSMEKALLSPYATVTKPRTVSHSSSGHGSDNSSTLSTDLISKQGSSTSDKQHGGTSSGYESMLRDSEGSGSSTAQEESANELSSGDKKKGSKKKRMPSTRRSRSVPSRSSESPESSSRKSSPSSKISRVSPSSTVRFEKHGKVKEEPLEIKEYDADDVKRMNRLRPDEDTLRKNHDKLKEIMSTKQEQEIPKGKDQYIVERGNWSFDCKFLMCFSCRSRKKTDV